MAFRFLIAAIIMIIFNFKKLKTIDNQTLFAGIILGIILYSSFAFQTFGLKYTTASKNAFLTSVNVIIVPFIVWALTKKKVDNFGFLGATLSIIGIGLLSLKSDFVIFFLEIFLH